MGKTTSVLIVDDDPVSSAKLAAVCRAAGYQVDTALNGELAWSAIQLRTYPIVISDWFMPEVDGIELCRRIRGQHRQGYVYFVLITAHGGKKQYLTGMEAGADDFITKPVDPDELLARMRVAERILGLRLQLETLEGLLSVCAYCKRIREEDSWGSLEQYVAKRTAAQFSHGICPECYTRVFESELGPQDVQA
ncbi:MAG: response regulator [Gemmatimonadota bacterium]